MNPRLAPSVVVLSLLALVSVSGKTTAKPKKEPAALVTFTSACAAKGQHGVDRWTPKTDASPVPNKSAIQKVTPSDICKWKGPGPTVPLTKKTETRLPVEQKWYELTGRVADVRVEADGDIHVALADATGMRVGVEVPVGARWCKFRRDIFSWTNAKFPFTIRSNKVFKILKPHVIAVTGKAFYDVDHAPKDHSNRSTIHEKTAAFEIHPVAGLHVVQ
jgi:hypothetical protein